jgi:molecular chaperone GrpE
VIGLVEPNHDAETEIEKLKEQLKKEQTRVEEYRKLIEMLKAELNEQASVEERYKYKLAEIDNYRKQIERESQVMVRREVEKFLIKLINLRDDFMRAIDTANSSDNPALVNGLQSVLKNLDSVLKEESVKEIDAVGKTFDPNIHEAVSFVDNDEYPENTITAEIRKGYMLSDRVIRPSLVEVSRKTNDKSNGDELNG